MAYSLLLALVFPAGAGTRLARVFDLHMVLQRDRPVTVFGTDGPRQPVRLVFAGHTRTTLSDENGGWRVDLPPLPALPP